MSKREPHIWSPVTAGSIFVGFLAGLAADYVYRWEGWHDFAAWVIIPTVVGVLWAMLIQPPP